MDPPRLLMVGNVPVYLPTHYDTSSNYVVESLIEALVSGHVYGCTQLADQSYQVQETIWSTLLSFIAFKRKTQQVQAAGGQGDDLRGEATPPSSNFRLIYLCGGFQALRMQMKLLHQLKQRLNVPDFASIRTTAFAEPVNMCINQKIGIRFKDSHQERNTACRLAVRCGRCPQYNNLFTSAVPRPQVPEAPDFLTDLEDISIQMDRANICPYYSMLSRLDTAHLILTTYDALKGTLSGQRLPKERLPLDKNTYLVCDDPFAMEKMFEECYDFMVGVPALQRTMALCVQRKRNLWEIQQSVLLEPFAQRQDFYLILRHFCQLLEKICRVIRGEVNISPETGNGRLRILSDLGLQKTDPRCLHRILTTLLTDVVFIRRFRRWEISQLIQDVSNIQQLFLNLTNPDVADWLFSTDEKQNNPFRFWRDRPDDAAEVPSDFGKLNFQFFGLSINPVFAALRRRGLTSLLCFGTMIPLSFTTIDPAVSFRTRRLSLAETSRPIPGLFSGLFAFGLGDVALNCHAEQREQPRYIRALGHAIRRIIEAVSDKVLILFPAMTYYESCSAVWKADESLRELGEMLQVVFSCGPGTCAICAGNMEFRQREGHSAMTFVRGATLDGVSGGYQAVVAVSLPYQFLLDPKIAAKKAFLSALDRTAAFDFYTQDAVHAMAVPFIKATALDPLSPLRGRIFIVLDSRLQKHLRFLPSSLQQTMKEYTTFEGAMGQLTDFLRRKIPDWDVSDGVDFIDPEVSVHIRQLHKNVLADTTEGSRMQVIGRLCDLVQQFRDDGNVDLLAAGLLDAIQLERQYESSEFPAHFLPWIMNFRHFFRTSRLRLYWPVVINNLFRQIAEKIEASDDSRLSFTLPSNSQYTWERCHVQ